MRFAAVLALAGCATVEPQPTEPRIEYRSYPVDRAVPCFTEAERPIRKPYTPVNLDTATVDQMAAAMEADDINDELFARAVDNLFQLCMRRIADGTATTPVGATP